MKKNIAFIDIGSNSIRLVIFQLDDSGYYKEIQNVKVVARLSSHIDKQGNISKTGITLLLSSLEKFQKIVWMYELTKIKCVATAAVRQAANQAEILKEISKNTIFTIDVLSEYEEAYFGYLAVVNSTNLISGITIDIGGGSTEITLFKERSLQHYISFPFGVISLKERFLKNDLPSHQELSQLRSFLMKEFQQVQWLSTNDIPVIGIGGSARNLSLIQQRKVNYPLAGLHQFEMSALNINEMSSQLAKLPVKQRQMIDGLSKERADIIIPAAEAIAALMSTAKAKTFIMSNKGLRDGLFYQELFQQREIAGFQDVAEESLYQLARNYEINMTSVNYLVRIASELFQQATLFSSLKFTMNELRLLQLGCRVVYIGEFISHEASSQHTYYLLTNLAIDGLTHFERIKIALIASFKSKSRLEAFSAPYQKWLSKEELEKIELLGAILKLSYSLNRTRQEAIQRLDLSQADGRKLILKLISHQEVFFEELQASKHKKHLERALKKSIEVQVQYGEIAN